MSANRGTLRLETERLRLRPWTEEDLSAFHAIWGDPEVIWWGANTSLQETRGGYERLLERHAEWPEGLLWFAVTPRDSDDILGDVILQPAPFVDGIEIGWHFRRDTWGQGYATEAARAVLRHGFETVGLDRIFAIVATRNAASLRVTEKLGMKPVTEMEYAKLPHVLFALDAPGAHTE